MLSASKAIGMATRSLLLLLLLWASSTLISITTLLVAEADDDNEAALLAFKLAAINGGDRDPLASWNSTSVVGGGFCSWEGVTCSRGGGNKRRRRRVVVALSLHSYGLVGTLSPAIGKLTYLRTLNLSANWFHGNIPASIGRLVRLQKLDLRYNTFSGELPTNISFCTGLTYLSISSNKLHGRIPVELGHRLTSLEVLWLANNSFLTGPIPGSLANMSRLYYLDLSQNQLQGPVPPELSSIGGLQYLNLYENNLSGLLPRSLYNLSSLKYFWIFDNLLSGTIPADIGNRFPNIETLGFFGNRFSGTIPSSVSNLSSLTILDFSSNSFSGGVPPNLGRLQGLTSLHMDNNKIEANHREGWEFITSLANCSQLRLLSFDNNSLSGELPGSIVNLSTTLQYLYFGDNNISGSIPPNIGNLFGLEIFMLANTYISGVIPESIGQLGNLAELGLYNTSLSGFIPSSLGNLTQLNMLYAYYGNLEGPIPASLGKLQNLFVLDLSTNRLNGSIPIEVLKLPRLSNYLDLSYNSLSGPLPTEVGSLANLNQLILSGNQLSGNIPDSIGNCISLERLLLDKNLFEGSVPESLKNLKGLTLLNLTMNKLSGIVPDTLCSIGGLQQLYLAHNNLSGQIPTCLQNLRSLSKLDLSFNDLQGEVPKRGVFRNGVNLSIQGNNKICGGRPQLHLPLCPMSYAEKKKRHLSKLLMITLISTAMLIFFSLVVALIHLIHKKLKQRQESQFNLTLMDEQYERISYQALKDGTDGFSEANLLGQGSYGTVYKCILPDQASIAAVKVFNLQQSGSHRSFVVECEALRRVRHRCLVKIITCCSSINHQGQEFKALVFEFVPNGSLNGWLHPISDMPTVTNTLSLVQRLDIAVDVMDAVDYLHNSCQPPIVHCDIKPSNILLAEDMRARVGDFGISRILPERAITTLQNSNSTTGIRGTIGYVAPEYGEGAPTSTLGDVYSLGILLLEMFTGRRPTNDMFRGSLDLHKFSEDALPDRVWEIADTTMWLHTDISHSSTRSKIKNFLVSVIALGISCSKKQPSERTPMQDVAIEMHAIRDSYLKFARSLEAEHERVATTLQ